MLVQPRIHSGGTGRRPGGGGLGLVFLRRADTGREGPMTVFPDLKKGYY